MPVVRFMSQRLMISILSVLAEATANSYTKDEDGTLVTNDVNGSAGDSNDIGILAN